MQVERAGVRPRQRRTGEQRVGTYPGVRDNGGKPPLTPATAASREAAKGPRAAPGWARVRLGRRRGNGPPCPRSVAGLRGRPATLGLRHGPDSYGRQQWGILDNGGNPDPATPRG